MCDYVVIRWATLTQSELIVGNSLIGNAVGSTSYEGVNADTNGTFNFFTCATDSSDNSVLNTTQHLAWGTGGDWNDLGAINLVSWVSISDTDWYNVTGDFKFNDGSYYLNVDEYDYFGSGGGDDLPEGYYTDHVSVYAYGTYGGSWSTWYMQLEDSYLNYNDGLVGTATGKISGVTPDSWSAGIITYTTTTKDQNDMLALSTDGTTLWESPLNSTYTERGYFKVTSLVNMPTVTAWNASGLFYYGDNVYELSLYEQKYINGQNTTGYTSSGTDDDVSVVNFITYVEGGYGAQSATQA